MHLIWACKHSNSKFESENFANMLKIVLKSRKLPDFGTISNIFYSRIKNDSDCNIGIFTSTSIFLLWLGGITHMTIRKKQFPIKSYCHNPNDSTTQHNLNTAGGLDMKMALQTPPPLPTSTTQQQPSGASEQHSNECWCFFFGEMKPTQKKLLR